MRSHPSRVAWLGACVLAARPKTLPAAIVPVWAGCVLAWSRSGAVDWLLAAFTLVGALCIQMATNCFNDAIDARKGADTAVRVGPLRVTASGLLAPRAVMTLGFAFLLAALLCGVPLHAARGWPVIAIGVPSMFLAYGYTGGPFPLAYRGWGEVFVILFFGFVAVAGTVFIQTGEWPREAWLLGGQIGLLSAVLISINNLRDRAEDAVTGKRTLAVRFGPKAAVALIWIEIKFAAFAGLLWIPLGRAGWVLAGLPVLLLGTRILWGVFTEPPGPAFNRLLGLAALALLSFAVAFHLIALRSA